MKHMVITGFGLRIITHDALTKTELSKPLLYSQPLEPGLYQWEFMENEIVVAKWQNPPRSTFQWAEVKDRGMFRFQGSCNEDLCTVSLGLTK